MPHPFHLLVFVVCSLAFFVGGALIAGGVMFTSVVLTEQPASWVGSIGTVLAAIGTVSTLGFLIWQNDKIQKAQTRRDAEDSRVKKTQYLENRKNNFYSLLDEIKHETSVPIEFKSKYALYKTIYPVSKINSDDYHRPCADFANKLSILSLDIGTRLVALESNIVQNNQFKEFFKSLTELQLFLHFELSGNNLVRNRIRKSNIFNTFRIHDTLNTYYQVASMICEECDIAFDVKPFLISRTTADKLEHQLFTKTSILYEMLIPRYAVLPIRHLYNLYKFTLDPRDSDIDFDYENMHELIDFFCLEQNFWPVVNNHSKLLKTLETHIEALSTIDANSEFENKSDRVKFNNIFRELREDHSKLLKEVRVQQFV